MDTTHPVSVGKARCDPVWEHPRNTPELIRMFRFASRNGMKRLNTSVSPRGIFNRGQILVLHRLQPLTEPQVDPHLAQNLRCGATSTRARNPSSAMSVGWEFASRRRRGATRSSTCSPWRRESRCVKRSATRPIPMCSEHLTAIVRPVSPFMIGWSSVSELRNMRYAS